MRYAWFGVIFLAMVASCAVEKPVNQPQAPVEPAPVTTSGDQPIAPGKFIPTFALNYGNSKYWGPSDEAAQFDLIVAGVGSVEEVQTWQNLKNLNPHLKIIVYELGPSEFKEGSKFDAFQGWDWITANHGRLSADRWTAIGAEYGDYLQGTDYPHERLMVIGNPNWQQFWIDRTFERIWSPDSPNRVADGVFADNTNYRMPFEGDWYRQGDPNQPDEPVDYYRHGEFAADIWKSQAKDFFSLAVPQFARQNRLLIPNFGFLARHPENWVDLDAMPDPVFGAMEEGAFATPWGAHGSFTFYNEQQWLNQVNTMRHLKHVRALMLVHGPIVSAKRGLRKLEFSDVTGTNRGWDILWFGITSFLQGYDDVRQNAYLGFTVWEYRRAFWLDEFDPAHLNLGRAIGESHRVDGATGHCYLREFESGWAVVNPTDADARGVAVPQGQARVLDHGTFEHAEKQPLVARFELLAHRGIVLLKPGRNIGIANGK